jgi:hypothetical protein
VYDVYHTYNVYYSHAGLFQYESGLASCTVKTLLISAYPPGYDIAVGGRRFRTLWEFLDHDDLPIRRGRRLWLGLGTPIAFGKPFIAGQPRYDIDVLPSQFLRDNIVRQSLSWDTVTSMKKDGWVFKYLGFSDPGVSPLQWKKIGNLAVKFILIGLETIVKENKREEDLSQTLKATFIEQLLIFAPVHWTLSDTQRQNTTETENETVVPDIEHPRDESADNSSFVTAAERQLSVDTRPNIQQTISPESDVTETPSSGYAHENTRKWLPLSQQSTATVKWSQIPVDFVDEKNDDDGKMFRKIKSQYWRSRGGIKRAFSWWALRKVERAKVLLRP